MSEERRPGETARLQVENTGFGTAGFSATLQTPLALAERSPLRPYEIRCERERRCN